MDQLEESWKQFKLTKAEDKEISIDDENLDHETRKGDLSLVGKVLTKRIMK